jgi:hypothetical protein
MDGDLLAQLNGNGSPNAIVFLGLKTEMVNRERGFMCLIREYFPQI